MPIYFVVMLILVAALFLIAIPIALAAWRDGCAAQRKATADEPSRWWLLDHCAARRADFFGVRLHYRRRSPALEDAGPIAIIRRSWPLTSGHWLPLLGFLLSSSSAPSLADRGRRGDGSVVVLLTRHRQPLSAGGLIIALVQSLVSAAVTTLFAVMLARIYLQLRSCRSGGEVR